MNTVAHSVVATSPDDFAAKYHNPMQVILPPEANEVWLTTPTGEAFDLLQPCSVELLALIGKGEGIRGEPF